ncbi:MAG: porin family protein [Niastella sp.]|uniref:porin family protein n=1 Tax=Niastella sp. TaxID=1869183 RepID=UPI0038999491
MKTKALLIALSTTVFALGAKAQDKTTFGVRAGVNFTNLNGKESNGDKLDNKLKAGFNVGVNAEIPLVPDFYVQPGLLFSTKGSKDKQGDGKLNLSYLEVPINLLYKPTLGAGKMLLGFGPYVGFGIGGKYKSGDEKIDVKFKNDVKPSDVSLTDPKIFLKSLDFGGNLLVGYEMSNNFSFQLNAQLGMTNLNPKSNGVKPKDKAKNTGFGISVGYRF